MKPQFIIAMNPRKQAVEFSLLNVEGNLQTVTFQAPKVGVDLKFMEIHWSPMLLISINVSCFCMYIYKSVTKLAL